MTFQHPARKRDDGKRGRFEEFAELASNFTSSPFFALLCLALVGVFVGVHAAGLAMEWQLLAGDAMGAVTLLLLALLKNAERRAEHAVQRKLDAIASALLEQQQRNAGAAQEELEQAIGMDERH
ncbi:low affinity iron permease family protein [Kitasatospora sp. NBC_01287]|uniref:low affinity iron permease family protein n=1 Tax=Kitasatospora sp. NBC_01287 TaxID=2903573 RepID=UPI0022503549|nr:low affinity iron permease family protein [Kitasatospora sp. NBC_01287]MCX4744927.1 low affinity iron permease family protein [Kitasatospora sp. NBC_01287]